MNMHQPRRLDDTLNAVLVCVFVALVAAVNVDQATDERYAAATPAPAASTVLAQAAAAAPQR